MGSKSRPAIPKNIRVPQDLLELIEEVCERERKTFTVVVIRRLWATFSEDWTFTGNKIKEINREIESLKCKKYQTKKIRHRMVKQRQNQRQEEKRRELEAVAEGEQHAIQIKTNYMNLLHDHVEGRKEVCVHINDPMDFMYFEGEPNPNYRKLSRGQLNPELLKFYNEHYHLLS